MVAERGEEQFQRLGFDDGLARSVVDDEMGEIRLARHRAERSEFGRGEAHQIGFAGAGIGNIVQLRLFGRGRQRTGAAAEMGKLHGNAL
jgi:hypothetical protein